MSRAVLWLHSFEDATGLHMYGCRFVEYVNHEGAAKVFDKSLFVIQDDTDNQHLLTHAPITSTTSKRLLFSTIPALEPPELRARDANQTFVQKWASYIVKASCATASSFLSPSLLGLAIYSQYRSEELRIQWVATCSSYHEKTLGMKESIYDIYFMYTKRYLANTSLLKMCWGESSVQKLTENHTFVGKLSENARNEKSTTFVTKSETLFNDGRK